MVRVVLDTNVLVSAMIQPQGLPARIFLLAVAGRLGLTVCGEMYSEYEEVLRRPRFRLPEAAIDGVLELIRQRGYWVRPSGVPRVCSDPDDDIFVACAQAGDADFLVTGNIRDFPADCPAPAIVTPRQFWAWWEANGS